MYWRDMPRQIGDEDACFEEFSVLHPVSAILCLVNDLHVDDTHDQVYRHRLGSSLSLYNHKLLILILKLFLLRRKTGPTLSTGAGLRIGKPGEIGPVMKEAQSNGRPAVVEVFTDQHEAPSFDACARKQWPGRGGLVVRLPFTRNSRCSPNSRSGSETTSARTGKHVRHRSTHGSTAGSPSPFRH
jgi:hypothetical protein